MYRIHKQKNLKKFTNIKSPVHHLFAHSSENNSIVSESMAEEPNVSIPRGSQELGLYCGTLQCILYLDLRLHPYKV